MDLAQIRNIITYEIFALLCMFDHLISKCLEPSQKLVLIKLNFLLSAAKKQKLDIIETKTLSSEYQNDMVCKQLGTNEAFSIFQSGFHSVLKLLSLGLQMRFYHVLMLMKLDFIVILVQQFNSVKHSALQSSLEQALSLTDLPPICPIGLLLLTFFCCR